MCARFNIEIKQNNIIVNDDYSLVYWVLLFCGMPYRKVVLMAKVSSCVITLTIKRTCRAFRKNISEGYSKAVILDGYDSPVVLQFKSRHALVSEAVSKTVTVKNLVSSTLWILGCQKTSQ
jgi:hypothetical protein